MLQGPVINHRRANKGESQAEVDAADWSHVIIGRLIPVWTSKTSKCPSRQTVRNLRYEEIQRDLLGHVTEQGGHSWPLLLNERCARYIAPIPPPPPPELQFQRAEEDKSVLVLEQSCVSPRACACARRDARSRACLHPVQSSCCLSARLSSQNGGSQNTIGLTAASLVLLVLFVIGSQGEQRQRTQTFAHSSAAEACRAQSPAKVDVSSHQSPPVL